MSLIHNEGVVAVQPGVSLGFSQENPVGHNLDVTLPGGFFMKTDFIAHGLPGGFPQLRGNSPGNGGGGDPAWLGAPDESADPPAGCQAEFWYLGGFTRSGFTGDDDHRMAFDSRNNFILFDSDGQVRRELGGRPVFYAGVAGRDRRPQTFFKQVQLLNLLCREIAPAGFAGQTVKRPARCSLIRSQSVGDEIPYFFNIWFFHGLTSYRERIPCILHGKSEIVFNSFLTRCQSTKVYAAPGKL